MIEITPMYVLLLDFISLNAVGQSTVCVKGSKRQPSAVENVSCSGSPVCVDVAGVSLLPRFGDSTETKSHRTENDSVL